MTTGFSQGAAATATTLVLARDLPAVFRVFQPLVSSTDDQIEPLVSSVSYPVERCFALTCNLVNDRL